MSETNQLEVTELLQKWSGGDAEALEQFTPVIYAELHRIAKRYMSRERGESHFANISVGQRSLHPID